MCTLRFVLTARFGTSALRSCESCVKTRRTSSIQRQKRPQSKSPVQMNFVIHDVRVCVCLLVGGLKDHELWEEDTSWSGQSNDASSTWHLISGRPVFLLLTVKQFHSSCRLTIQRAQALAPTPLLVLGGHWACHCSDDSFLIWVSRCPALTRHQAILMRCQTHTIFLLRPLTRQAYLGVVARCGQTSAAEASFRGAESRFMVEGEVVPSIVVQNTLLGDLICSYVVHPLKIPPPALILPLWWCGHLINLELNHRLSGSYTLDTYWYHPEMNVCI